MMLFIVVEEEQWLKSMERDYYPPEASHTIALYRAEQLYQGVMNHYSNLLKQGKDMILLLIPQKRIKDHIIWKKLQDNEIRPVLLKRLPITAVEELHFLQWKNEQPWVLTSKGKMIPLQQFVKPFFSKKQYKDGHRFY